jgi:hypothetical protein
MLSPITKPIMYGSAMGFTGKFAELSETDGPNAHSDSRVMRQTYFISLLYEEFAKNEMLNV